MDPKLVEALAATSEGTAVDFKVNMNVDSRRDWVETVKDIVAMANSGGGVILFGVDDIGRPTGDEVTHVATLDAAIITDKVYSYTNCHFADFTVVPVNKGERQLAAIVIGPSSIPLVFTRPGTYPKDERTQGRAFSVGQVYFRHGAKSEPGTHEDLQQAVERRLETIRVQWLSGIRSVVRAPEGAHFAVLPPEVRQSTSPEAVPIRIVDDPLAPGYRVVDPNATHPYRQTELLEELHRLLPDHNFNAYDLLAVRRVYGIDDDSRFFFRPKYGSPQYSEEFISWLVDKAIKNDEFFADARQRYGVIRYG